LISSDASLEKIRAKGDPAVLQEIKERDAKLAALMSKIRVQPNVSRPPMFRQLSPSTTSFHAPSITRHAQSSVALPLPSDSGIATDHRAQGATRNPPGLKLTPETSGSSNRVVASAAHSPVSYSRPPFFPFFQNENEKGMQTISESTPRSAVDGTVPDDLPLQNTWYD
jgi:hypothetical protein